MSLLDWHNPSRGLQMRCLLTARAQLVVQLRTRSSHTPTVCCLLGTCAAGNRRHKSGRAFRGLCFFVAGVERWCDAIHAAAGSGQRAAATRCAWRGAASAARRERVL